MADSSLPATIHDVETPCFLVDIDKVRRNCERMQDMCKTLGIRLRPHMKTHKTIEGGDLATGGSRRGIVVSTVAEAEFYADNGFDDILWAQPIVKEKISKRVLALVQKLDLFSIMVDSVDGIDGVIITPIEGHRKWSVFLEVDCGYGRTGCRWDSDELLTICRKAVAAPNVVLQGLYTHCGNTYVMDLDLKKKIQRETCDNLLTARDRLKEVGIDCVHYEVGSTPGCSTPFDGFSKLTGVHPGNYILFDYQGVRTNSCTLDDIACKVATTVISHKPRVGNIVVDCGWSAIGQDGLWFDKTEAPLGCCPVEGHPELRLIDMTQELGKITAAEGKPDFTKYPLGSRLYIYPHHSCAAALLHSVYYIHSGEKIVGVWKPVRGW